MITQVKKFTPTKVAMAKKVRCDSTIGGIGSLSIDQTESAKVRPGYEEKIAALNESNKEARRTDGGEYQDRANTSCRQSTRHKSTYRQIGEMNAEMAAGGQYTSQAEIESLVESNCSVVQWPQLGGRTVDEAMALPQLLPIHWHYQAGANAPGSIQFFGPRRWTFQERSRHGPSYHPPRWILHQRCRCDSHEILFLADFSEHLHV
jgi:hypothetical protein